MATLLLNSDAQPVNLLPISVVSWQDSIRYLVLDKVHVVSWYENWIVRSQTWETHVPAVIMLKDYQKPKRGVRLSKRNIYLRDNYSCQYCGISVTEHTATLDHVIPLSKGGRGTWDNLATACRACNGKKSDKTHMKPSKMPYKPDYYELVNKRKNHGFRVEHESWTKFLG
jgi:5-methylcytosine-specific restriction endonuclease McrA